MNTFQKLVRAIETDKNLRKEIIQKLNYKDLASGTNKLLTQLLNKTIQPDKLRVICLIVNYDSDEVVDDYINIKEIIKKDKAILEENLSLKEQIKIRDEFKPYIYIAITRQLPESITIASLVGDKIKYIRNLADNIQDLSKENQLDIVKGIILDHYKSNQGQCLLFDSITGYTFYKGFNEKIHFSNTGEIINSIPRPTEALI